jgi:hypothetical protein
MVSGRQLRRSDLFLVRFWAGEAGDGATKWQGKVQRTVTGEACYFHDWSELIKALSMMLTADDSDVLPHIPKESGSE